MCWGPLYISVEKNLVVPQKTEHTKPGHGAVGDKSLMEP